MDNLPIAIIFDKKNHMRIIRSRLRDDLNPFEIDDTRFQELYRLPKILLINLISSIEDYFPIQTYHTAIPCHLQVLAALNYFATGGYQRQVGMNFLCNLSQTKVSQCVRLVSTILSTKLLNTHVKFPVTEEDMSQIKHRFLEKTEMPGVIGIIDGTQIKICALHRSIENMYLNRKGFHSINAQIICDDELKITNVNARYPGSSHDSFIFNNSHVFHNLKLNFNANQDKYTWLLGDSGYALQPWLITPFPRSSDVDQTNFNKKHAHVRSAVERCIGLLKVRFRCLMEERGIRYEPTIVGHMINACCILHNIMISVKPTAAEEVEILEIQERERRMHNDYDGLSAPENESIREKGIVDGNAKTDVSNRREPGMFCGEAEQPQTFISETSYVKILFYTDNFTDQTYFSFDSRAEQQMEVYLRYGQHPELYPNRRGEVVQGSYCEREFRDCRLQTCYVQSPAYPGLYPRALKCRYRLHTRQPFIKLYLQNEHFSVDGQRCENIMTCPMREIGSGSEHCPYDWLAVYDGRDEHSPLIGKFCGMGKFPFSIIGTSQYMYVEFVSSPAGPLLNTGFHFNVGNWPGHVDTAGVKHGACDWLLSSDALKTTAASEGIFLSVAHWYPPNTSCNYHIQGSEGEIVRLYFPSFRINKIEAAIRKYDGDCAESLTIYDSERPDPARIIKTFCDTFSRPMEKVDFVSSSRSMYVRFESKTGSYSGSSLYYWAHYDFFNNTKFGDPVSNTLCDEIFHAWKHTRGKIRSPLNTLIFKRTGGTDVRCQYRFVTDRRLYSRVVIEVTTVSFKDLPYNLNACTRCHEERVDKLVIWEEKDKNQNHLACFCDNIPRAVRVISSGEQLNLEMIVQGQHATSSYFKNPNPLFEANYEFAHGPLCGPITLGPSPDGELVFPYRNALGLPATSDSKKEKCIWELKVAAQRDLWLHLDKARFADRGCEQGRIEVYLAGRLEPRFIICPENISLARDLPILSAAELGALDSENEPLPVLIQYTGDNTPGRNAFRMVWTELFHLPRNADGTLATQMLQDGDCDFRCPGSTSVCIPKHLVCNGIMNCPNITITANSLSDYSHLIEDNLKKLDIYFDEKLKNLKILLDESPELCSRSNKIDQWSYVYLLLIAAGLSLLLALFLALLCRMCRRKY